MGPNDQKIDPSIDSPKTSHSRIDDLKERVSAIDVPPRRGMFSIAILITLFTTIAALLTSPLVAFGVLMTLTGAFIGGTSALSFRIDMEKGTRRTGILTGIVFTAVGIWYLISPPL